MSEKSLLIRLTHNPGFPPGLLKGYFNNWNEGQISQIFHICPNAVCPKWEQIREKLQSFFEGNISNFNRSPASYHIPSGTPQMTNSIQTLKIDAGKNNLHFCNLQDTLISTTQSSSHFKKWGEALNTTFTKQELEGIILKSFTGQRSCKVQENNYKIITGWYNTPNCTKYFQALRTSAGAVALPLAHYCTHCGRYKLSGQR